MARLTWDGTGTRWYEVGTSQGVLYPMKADGTGYDTGVAWNGLTAVTDSPDGAEANDMYADDIKYASLRSAETAGGTIEAYTYPDEFIPCDGGATDSAKGLVIGQQGRRKFGFCYKTKMGNDTTSDVDAAYKLHIVYGATASPSEKSYETINDSPEGMTFSWDFDTTPVAMKNHKPVATLTIDSRTATQVGLKALEDALYGTDTVEARLPLPDEVATLLGKTA